MGPLKRPNTATSKFLRRRSHYLHSEVYSDVTETLGLLQKPNAHNKKSACFSPESDAVHILTI